MSQICPIRVDEDIFWEFPGTEPSFRDILGNFGTFLILHGYVPVQFYRDGENFLGHFSFLALFSSFPLSRPNTIIFGALAVHLATLHCPPWAFSQFYATLQERYDIWTHNILCSSD